MKGLEISQEKYEAILSDPNWLNLLVFKEDMVFVDLKKYSALGHYLPVNSEYQTYVVGYLFMKDLFSCVYRSQDDLVYIHTPKEEILGVEYREVETPMIEPISMNQEASALDHIPSRKTIKEIRPFLIKKGAGE